MFWVITFIIHLSQRSINVARKISLKNILFLCRKRERDYFNLFISGIKYILSNKFKGVWWVCIGLLGTRKRNLQRYSVGFLKSKGFYKYQLWLCLVFRNYCKDFPSMAFQVTKSNIYPYGVIKILFLFLDVNRAIELIDKLQASKLWYFVYDCKRLGEHEQVL